MRRRYPRPPAAILTDAGKRLTGFRRAGYWGLGNEMYGDWQIGQRTAAEHVAQARSWARALKMLDPGISLVSCGQSGLDDWDRVVIDGLAREVDWHSIHLYTGSADYWANVLAPHHAEHALSVAGALIDRARYAQRIEHEISVAYDEWNVRYRTDHGRLEERYNLADALAVATYLNVFVRKCRTVRMANLAQLVNVIAPIVTSPGGIFTQSIYHPFQLMAAASHEVALDTVTDSGTVDYADRSGDWHEPPQLPARHRHARGQPGHRRLLTGGDGTHMQAMEAGYLKSHPGVSLQSTILLWGSPYYTKLAMAIRSGSPPTWPSCT